MKKKKVAKAKTGAASKDASLSVPTYTDEEREIMARRWWSTFMSMKAARPWSEMSRIPRGAGGSDVKK